MRRLCVVAALLLLAPSCSLAAEKKGLSQADYQGGTASSDTLRLVHYLLETETSELAPETIPPFMAIDAATLPPKVQGAYLAKREELLALKKIADGKKKAYFRRMGNEEEAKCEVEKGTERQLQVMKVAGFERIEENEVLNLMQKTSCSECELQTEFTLRILLMPPKKKDEKPWRAYFLYETDPIWAVVAAQRGGSGGGTNFFGMGAFPKCR